MIGKRTDYDPEKPERFPVQHLQIGEYGKDQRSTWRCRAPNGLLGNLEGHEVVEHPDGTITVTPSILIEQPNVGQWYGYLEKGTWREA